MIKLYKVYADYRPDNSNRIPYYVRASSKSKAKIRFYDKVTWLKIYKVEDCTEEEAVNILSNRDKHIIF